MEEIEIHKKIKNDRNNRKKEKGNTRPKKKNNKKNRKKNNRKKNVKAKKNHIKRNYCGTEVACIKNIEDFHSFSAIIQNFKKQYNRIANYRRLIENKKSKKDKFINVEDKMLKALGGDIG